MDSPEPEHFLARSWRLRTEIAEAWGLTPMDLSVVDYGRKLVIRTTSVVVGENTKDGWKAADDPLSWS